MSTYPEHDKLIAIKDHSQAIGEFLDWLPSQGLQLCHWDEDDFLNPIHTSIETLLAKYFEIDLNKIEAEKDAMLEEMRRANG